MELGSRFLLLLLYSIVFFDPPGYGRADGGCAGQARLKKAPVLVYAARREMLACAN